MTDFIIKNRDTLFNDVSQMMCASSTPFLQHLFEGLCKGGSASWWRNRHNKHHAKVRAGRCDATQARPRFP